MPDDMPDISVVIPTHNRTNMLEECLKALLEQTFSNFEIVVVGSPEDKSESMIKREFGSNAPIRYLKQKNVGTIEARNIGVDVAKGEIIAFTDDDCIPELDWLEKIQKKMKKADGVEGIITAPKESVLTPFSHIMINLKGEKFLTSNMAYKKDVFKEIGGFHKGFQREPPPFREDSDLAFSILEGGHEIKFDKKICVKHPVYPKSFKSFLRDKKRFEMDPLLYKRHPELYKKYVKFPFEMFTPFYSLLSIILVVGLVFYPWLALVSLLSLILTGIIELLKRRWKATPLQFFKFLVGQVAGSFIIIYSVLKGCWRFKVNPLKLLVW